MAVALVVDDDVQIRSMIEEICGAIGLQVISANDGVEAVEALERDTIDVILLDINMPRLDGFGVLERLRAMPLTPRPAVIVVTADADVEGRVRGTELGALDFVTKPFMLRDLRRRIERAVSIVELERRLEDAEATLEQMRMHDPVTGAGTFGMLQAALDAQFQCARVTGKELSCVVVSDERYNEALREQGREAGEERLQRISKRLESLLRGADLLFRVDAAEFVILLPGTPLPGVRRVVERIRETLSEEARSSDAALVLAAATYPHPDINQPSLLYRAVNVTLAQARSREGRRVAYFEGF